MPWIFAHFCQRFAGIESFSIRKEMSFLLGSNEFKNEQNICIDDATWRWHVGVGLRVDDLKTSGLDWWTENNRHWWLVSDCNHSCRCSPQPTFYHFINHPNIPHIIIAFHRLTWWFNCCSSSSVTAIWPSTSPSACLVAKSSTNCEPKRQDAVSQPIQGERKFNLPQGMPSWSLFDRCAGRHLRRQHSAKNLAHDRDQTWPVFRGYWLQLIRHHGGSRRGPSQSAALTLDCCLRACLYSFSYLLSVSVCEMYRFLRCSACSLLRTRAWCVKCATTLKYAMFYTA